MKIVIAMDSFKGSLTAQEACQIIADGFVSIAPHLEIVTRPMADGGEGTAQEKISAFEAVGVQMAHTPEEVAANKNSHTGRFLQQVLA